MEERVDSDTIQQEYSKIVYDQGCKDVWWSCTIFIRMHLKVFVIFKYSNVFVRIIIIISDVTLIWWQIKKYLGSMWWPDI